MNHHEQIKREIFELNRSLDSSDEGNGKVRIMFSNYVNGQYQHKKEKSPDSIIIKTKSFNLEFEKGERLFHNPSISSIYVYTDTRHNFELCLKIYKSSEEDIIHIINKNPEYGSDFVPAKHVHIQTHIADKWYYTIMPKMKMDLAEYRDENPLKVSNVMAIFNTVLRQMQNISKLVIPLDLKNKKKKVFGECMFYGDLKLNNILIDEDEEVKLCDLDSMNVSKFNEAGVSFVPPETLFERRGYNHVTNGGVEFRLIDMAGKGKYEKKKYMSFIFGAFLVELLFPGLRKYAHGTILNEHYEFFKKYYKGESKVKRLLKEVYNESINIFMESLQEIFGDDIANLLHPDPTQRTDLENVKFIVEDSKEQSVAVKKLAKFLAEKRTMPKVLDIHIAIEKHDWEKVQKIVSFDPKCILQLDLEGSGPFGPLQKAIDEIYQSKKTEDKDKLYKIVDILTDTDVCNVKDVKTTINRPALAFGQCPLFSVCEYGLTELIPKFMELGGNISFTRRYKNYSLIDCAKYFGTYSALEPYVPTK